MNTHCTNISTGYVSLFLQGLTPATECSPLYVQLRHYWQRHTTRRQLAKLTVRQLQDVGLTPEQVNAEIKKPFWR